MSLTKDVFILLTCCISTVLLQRQSQPFSPTNYAGEVSPVDRQFRVVYEWRTLDFIYRSELEHQDALLRGDFIPENVIVSDIKPYGRRLYFSLPRMMPGVPATLGWVVAPDNDGRTDPPIEPFPSWEMNQRGNCSALQFVQGIEIDASGIMYVVDSGRTETLKPNQNQVVCPAKLVLLDLKRNGTVIHRYEFPDDVVPRGLNYLNKLAVDDALGGYAYITDNSGADPGIVVYSRRLNRSWKVREDQTMRAAQNAVAFSVNGTSLNFSIHIDGITLGPYYDPAELAGVTLNPRDRLYNANNERRTERNVFYSPLSSYHLYSIPASLLRDPEFAARATQREVLQAITDHGVKASQTDGMVMDNRGILYFSLLRQHAIAQWDSFTPFTYENQNIVARDDLHIQWTDGMGFDEEGFLYVVVNRLHNFVAGRLNPAEVNFRVLRSKTGTLSYVHTARRGDDGIFIPDAVNPDYVGISSISDNGILLSSTTPSFEGRTAGTRHYYNAAASGYDSYRYFTLVLVVVVAALVR